MKDSLAAAELTHGKLYSLSLELQARLNDAMLETNLPDRVEDFSEDLYSLAALLEHSGFTLESLKVKNARLKLAAASGSEIPTRVLTDLGWSALYLGDIENAVSVFESSYSAKVEYSHAYEAGLIQDLILWAKALGHIGDTESALTKSLVVEKILRADRLKNRASVRSRYQLGQMYLWRADIFHRAGESQEAQESLRQARAIIEPLYKEFDIIYVRNTYAMILLMQGDIETAKPVVEALLWDGWRRADFMELVEEKNAFPDPMPPPLDIPTELPPKLQAYIDSLPEVPMPWEESFERRFKTDEPDG